MTNFKKTAVPNYLLIIWALLFLPVQTHAAEQPNFLVITVDDLKRVIGVMADRPGNLLNQLYPDPQVRASIKAVLTPNIDRLAASGTLFANTYAVAPVCNPSRISLATGTRPDISGFTTNRVLFRDEPAGASLITMQQNLRNNGYFASGVGKIFHKSKIQLSADGRSVTEDWPDAQYSWDVWMNRTIGISGDITFSPYSTSDGAITFGSVTDPLERQYDYVNASYIADLLDDGSSTFYDSVYKENVDVVLPTDSPFYLGLGIYLPHQPFVAPTDIVSLFDPALMQLDANSLQAIQDDLLDLSPTGKYASGADGQIITEFQKLLQKGLEQDGAGGDLAAWKAVVQHYLAAVAVADRSVGLVLDALANSAYRDNTIVILHSDHGFNLGEKNRLGKNDNWDESTGTVMIVSKPGALPAVVENSVSLQDIYPTVSALAQVELPANVLGNDLSAYFTDPSLHWSKPNFTSQGAYANRHSIRTDRFRYIRFYDDSADAELYDLLNDPNELVNLIAAPDYQSEREALNQLLDNVRANGVSAPVIASLEDVFTDTDFGIDTLINVQAWQAAGEVITFTATDLPAGIQLDNKTGVISGRARSSGLFYPTIEAASDSGSTSTSFAWTIAGGANDNPPVWVAADLDVIATGSETIELRWSGATSTTGITGYQISVDEVGGASDTLLITSTTAVIENLQPLTQYLITVQAMAENGSLSSDGPSVLLQTSDVSGQPAVYISTLSAAPVPGLAQPFDDATVYSFNGSDYSKHLVASERGLLSDADVNALASESAEHFYVSFNKDTVLPEIGIVSDRDIVEYDNGEWSVFLTGSDIGLTRTAHDIDGLSFFDNALYFSIIGPVALPGVGVVDDADILQWTGTQIEKRWDASDNGLAADADINGLSVLSDNRYLMSFNAAETDIPTLGNVQDEDIVEFNDGVWSVYFDGTANGLVRAGHEIDAFSIGTASAQVVPPIDTTPPAWMVSEASALSVTTDSVELQWTQAQDDTAVAGYTVLYTDGTELMTLDSASNAITIDNLLPGTAYTFEIQATDDAGNVSVAGPVVSVDTEALAAPALTKVTFSTVGNTAMVDVAGRADDADVYSWDGASLARQWDASDYGLTAGADIDAISMITEDHFYLSFGVTSTSVPGLGLVQDEDVLEYNNGTWSIYFDGTAAGLIAGGHDIDGLSVIENTLYFSTLGDSRLPGFNRADDADIYTWNNGVFARIWDATEHGVTASGDIDALMVLGENRFVMSFTAAFTYIAGFGAVPDENLVEFNDGVWSLYFDGTANGLTPGGLDIDAVGVLQSPDS